MDSAGRGPLEISGLVFTRNHKGFNSTVSSERIIIDEFCPIMSYNCRSILAILKTKDTLDTKNRLNTMKLTVTPPEPPEPLFPPPLLVPEEPLALAASTCNLGLITTK